MIQGIHTHFFFTNTRPEQKRIYNVILIKKKLFLFRYRLNLMPINIIVKK
jgi:hypothetical protein